MDGVIAAIAAAVLSLGHSRQLRLAPSAGSSVTDSGATVIVVVTQMDDKMTTISSNTGGGGSVHVPGTKTL